MAAQTSTKAKTAAVVYNPVKVNLKNLKAAVKLAESRAGWNRSHWFETSVLDPGGEVTKEALAGGADVVLAAGGDGTIRAVAESLRGTGVPLALLPSGTGNLLARNLALTLDNLAVSIETAFTGRSRAIDVGLVEAERPDGSRSSHVFLVMAGLGLDAQMAANTNAMLKARVGWIAYIDAIARGVRENNSVKVRYSVDGGSQRTASVNTVIVGNCVATEVPDPAESSVLWDELTRLSPSEVVLPAGPEMEKLRVALVRKGFSIAELTPTDFSSRVAEERLKMAFKTGSLRGFGLEDKPQALAAAGAVLRYLENTQCGRPFSTKPLRTYAIGETLQMDAATLAHLDLLPDHGTRPGQSLLEVLDHTLTPMGGRLLRRWLVAPLRNVKTIDERLDRVAFFVDGKEARRTLRALLQGWPDFERILARLSAGSTAPRDLSHLARGLQQTPKVQGLLWSSSPADSSGGSIEGMGRTLMSLMDPPLESAGDDGKEIPFPIFPQAQDLVDLLNRSIVEAPPATLKEGGVIRDGFHAELDEVRGWIREGKERLLELEQKEREATGISSLKVSFNNVFGYYLEVTKTHLAKVPAHYHRKQTTANGERYITPELKEFETRILGAEERALRLEAELVQQLREAILKQGDTLRRMADILAQIDVAQSLAELADKQRYVRPTVDESTTLRVKDGRHPVLEDVLPSGTLVANDIDLNGNDRQILILTGPNMSGKSTYLRQTALISILAQMGSFVPAAEAHVGALDYLFTRIGASDRLADGESTFMVEMVETARILNHATPRSLVILDEVGRGTSTYDGMAIAGACLEFLNGKGPKVLFATHFFELTAMSDRFPGIHNAHVSAREWGDDVVFLHKVEPGPADRAYGIHVARLAGVPKPVLDRAAVLLAAFENTTAETVSDAKPIQPSLFDRPNDTLLNEFRAALAETDLNALTPIQALMLLQTWQSKLRKD